MVELIVSEKPSAAEKIAASFGNSTLKRLNGVKYWEVDNGQILIGSAVGHLFGLKKTERFYPVFNLEWQPSYENRGGAFQKPYFKTLKSLGKKVDVVTVATDYDIEGEVIGLNIVRELLGLKDANRMKFSTLTVSELQEAYKNKKNTLNWGQANAGIVRHTLDWYYGINLSQIISSSLSKALNRYQPLSIGRVQGPSLAILAERELEIKKFKPDPYWQIIANLWLNSRKFQAIHEHDKFWKKDEADKIFTKVKDRPGRIVDIEKRKQKVLVPVPFDLTSLQIEAYRVFKYSPSMTLKIAQTLYTKALISYPRTSSQKLPKALNFKKIISKLGSNTAYYEIAKEVLDTRMIPKQGRKSDPAHPAIHPTGERVRGLSEYDKKIYDLIVRRFFSVFGQDGERETTAVKLDVETEIFKFSGTVTTKIAWQKWYGSYASQKELELPVMKIRQTLTQNTELLDKETQPPARYNVASLIKLLEKLNLGTKATRSQIIETLVKRNYIQGNPIEVTDFGMKVFNVFKKHAPEVLSSKLTRNFEKGMDGIREGKVKSEVVIQVGKDSVTKLYAQLKESSEAIGKSLSASFVGTKKKQVTLFKCAKCKENDLVVRRSRASKKRFIACSGYPTCRFTWPLPQKGILSVVKNKKCEHCSIQMLQARTGRRKPWLFCPNPDCEGKKKDESEDS
jgi:DNA topoisomerase-1